MVNTHPTGTPTDVAGTAGFETKYKDSEVQVGALRIGSSVVLTPTEAGDVQEVVNAHNITGSTTVAADTLVIPVTSRVVVKNTGADAEACTLANGVPGQILSIYLNTDGGGDATLTPATSTGWGTIVFADTGDAATLLYVDDTIGWVMLAVYGLTAQPTIT